MTWLVFAVSGLLVLAGAVSISSGAPIIQLERGWAEVIAGTVAFSSGGVVFALGVILMRLEALREAMSRPAGVPASVGPDMGAAIVDPTPPPVGAAVPEPLPMPSRPVPAVEAVAEQHAPDVEVPQTESNQGLWKRIKRPAQAADIAPLEAGGFPDRVAAEPQVPAVPPVASDPEVAHPTVPAATLRPEPAAGEETGQLGWLDRSLLKSRTGPARTAAGLRQEPRVEPDLHGLVGEPPAAPGHDHGAKPTTSDPAPQAVPADEGPTVIGRYQAGVASYVMYSDGTIEVETESGQSHRFDSMDELKAFIAKQDQTDG